MSLPALHNAADVRTITERVNVLIRDYNRTPRRLVPAGTVLPFAGAVAPDGFLPCAGQAVSRTDYADLFASIGTTYGVGDGSTTFNLPDLRGRVAAGKDDMNGTAANRITAAGSGITGTTLGAAGGLQTHTLTTPQIPSHQHSFPVGNAFVGVGAARSGWGDGANPGNLNVVATGGGGAHNNTQPTLILNYVIAT